MAKDGDADKMEIETSAPASGGEQKEEEGKPAAEKEEKKDAKPEEKTMDVARVKTEAPAATAAPGPPLDILVEIVRL